LTSFVVIYIGQLVTTTTKNYFKDSSKC
jgi:hypothetical protein